MQDGHVIVYEGRLLQGPEMTLHVYEKELLALIHALTTMETLPTRS